VKTPDGWRNPDALELQSAMTVRARYAEVNPYAFEPAIAPHIAACEAGRAIEFAVLDRCFERLSLQGEVIIVEGAGGWLAPLDARHSFADLAVRWRLDVILVVGLRLGCLNHALLTAESVARHGLVLKGWIGNSVDPSFERRAENLAALAARLAAPCLAVFDFQPAADRAHIAAGLAAALPELERTAR
jgi:dethiobiotin synthetase